MNLPLPSTLKIYCHFCFVLKFFARFATGRKSLLHKSEIRYTFVIQAENEALNTITLPTSPGRLSNTNLLKRFGK